MSKKLQALIRRSKTLKKRGVLKFDPAYSELLNCTSFLPQSAFVSTRIWHVENQIFKIPKCKSCQVAYVKWRKEHNSYNIYCSSKCAHSDSTIKEKTKKTNLKKYGVTCAMHNKNINSKIKDKLRIRYGVDNVSQIPEVKEKKRKISLIKFGTDYPLQSSSVRAKINKTNLEKYGSKNFLASKDGKDKIQKTIQKKYNRNFTNQQHIPTKVLEQLNDKNWVYEQHFILKKSLIQIAQDLNINDTTVGKYLHKHHLTAQHYFTSTGQNNIENFLQKHNIKIIKNSRTIIPPYELDIFLPDYNLAIEYCGLYWHSEQNGKHKNYHKTKLQLCNKIGIRLLTIYEDEWVNKQIIIEQKILAILGKDNREKIYARKCNIVNVSLKDKSAFFERTHIQGNGASSINIGLISGDELVAIVGFVEQKNQYYLNRYATSKMVVGGFSKLLKYFENNYKRKKIVSFADLRWSDGSLYKRCGFVLDKILSPDYYYSPDGHVRIHKFNYRRKNLKQLLRSFDPKISETQNCNNNNILRIWDCGKLRFIINN